MPSESYLHFQANFDRFSSLLWLTPLKIIKIHSVVLGFLDSAPLKIGSFGGSMWVPIWLPFPSPIRPKITPKSVSRASYLQLVFGLLKKVILEWFWAPFGSKMGAQKFGWRGRDADIEASWAALFFLCVHDAPWIDFWSILEPNGTLLGHFGGVLGPFWVQMGSS